MAADTPDPFGFDTLACRAGQSRTQEQEHSEALFLTSSFCFANAAEAAARFSGAEPGNVYSRFTNPTVRMFEQRLAVLEGGERGIATASGMSAILTVCMSLLSAGDHVVCSRDVFGATVNLFKNILGRFGLATTFVPLTDISAWAAAITPKSRLLFLESPSNPLTDVADIRALADLAHAHGCLLVVDNCFCTPALQRPLDLGADLVVHSATKYLDGQGRCIGGAIVGPETLLGDSVFGFLRTAGPSMSPFNAWVFLKGLETLSLRMRQHSVNAERLAAFLAGHPKVTRVYHSSLSSHPQHELALRQQRSHGGIVAFEVTGDRAAAWRVVDATRIFSITANLGDAKSTITHPATTTHGRVSPEDRAAMGIRDNLLRLSAGLEDGDDLVADIDRALAEV
jgi:O-succinylhomoserine sulfhydrylase